MIEFQASLIVVNWYSDEAGRTLKENCSHVVRDVYIMEGDLEVLYEAGILFNLVAEGPVGSLGGLSEAEMIAVCDEAFGVDANKLQYRHTERWKPRK